jgi:SAM-dependent methyltransferase
MKTFLHVSCGPVTKSQIPGFNNDNWKELRLDIDKNFNPDIVGTLTDMSLVETDSIDAIYSSHKIERVFPHEVPIIFKEFYRVLKEDGIVVITCPDLQGISELVAQDKLYDKLYDSALGPITPMDILYGHIASVENGNEYIAHKCGFTYSVLNSLFFKAGFNARYGGRRPEGYDLFLVAFKQKIPEKEIIKIASPFLPFS